MHVVSKPLLSCYSLDRLRTTLGQFLLYSILIIGHVIKIFIEIVLKSFVNTLLRVKKYCKCLVVG